METLKSVFVFSRHGARFPLHNLKRVQNWPHGENFWEDYKGYLTPAGSQQMRALARLLRDAYPSVGLDGRSTYVYTTRSQRTLFSAQAWVDGFLPGVPTVIRGVAEGLIEGGLCTDVDVSDLYGPDQPTDTLVLNTWTTTEKDPLLQQPKAGDGSKVYKKFKKAMLAKSPRFDEWLADPSLRCEEILDKLWNMTGFEMMNPETNDLKARLQRMQTIRTQINIETALGMVPLRNPLNLALTREEEQTMDMVAFHIWRLKFQGVTEEDQYHGGRMGAHTLFRHISGIMQQQLQGACPYDFLFFSAHDGTLLAMLSRMGIAEMPIPKFGGSIIMELHADDASGDAWVNVRYTIDPFATPIADTAPVRLHPTDIVHWDDRTEGATPFDDFLALASDAWGRHVVEN